MNSLIEAIKKWGHFEKNFLLYSCLSIYLLWGVGLFSDDFIFVLHQQQKENFLQALVPSNSFLSLPFEQLTHIWFLYFCDLRNCFIAQVLKVIYVIGCLYMCARFFSLFVKEHIAFLVAFLFIYYPSHESTVYWYLSQYLMITISCYLYSYYLLEKGKLKMAVLFAFMASFISYGSPAPAWALAFLAFRKLDWKKTSCLIIPNLIYTVYYIITSKFINVGIQRIPDQTSIGSLLKQFVLQILTFGDAVMGPSVCLKIYYSFWELSFLSLIFISLTVFVYKKINGNLKVDSIKIDWDLLICFFLLAVIAFSMFALTGMYPNLAFNLGNRTNIFGCLFVVYVLLWILSRKSWLSPILLVIVVSIFGISDHWKKTTKIQDEAVREISHLLKNNNQINLLHIAGLQYSKMRDIDHIELFSGNWVCNAIVQLISDNRVSAMAINPNLKIIDGKYADIKEKKKYDIPDTFDIYDLDKHQYVQLKRNKINDYIANLAKPKRHWIQAIENRTIKKWILQLMPRLKYAFE